MVRSHEMSVPGVKHVTLSLVESYWDGSAFETDKDLPAGWMRVQDTSGTYYWHIPTGTTQWEPPGPLEERPASTSPALTPADEPQVRTHAHYTS